MGKNKLKQNIPKCIDLTVVPSIFPELSLAVFPLLTREAYSALSGISNRKEVFLEPEDFPCLAAPLSDL